MNFRQLKNYSKTPDFILLKLVRRISVSKRLTFKSKFIDFRNKPKEIELQKPEFKKTAATPKKESSSRVSKVERVCHCGCAKKFMARVADVERGWGKYFSKSCKARKQSIDAPISTFNFNYDPSWDAHKDVF